SELGPVRAGPPAAAPVELENAGSAQWRDLTVSYHWLDARGNPIVWDGIRHPVAADPGKHIERDLQVRGPIPPGRYKLAFDLVEEGRFWLAELGNFTPELDVDVGPRDTAGAPLFFPGGGENKNAGPPREGTPAGRGPSAQTAPPPRGPVLQS